MKKKYLVKYLDQATRFLNSLPYGARQKIMYNVNLVLEGNHDRTVFKKLEGHDIWEIRTKFNGVAYRLFTFFDKYTKILVVATHGIIKKSQKTPLKEIKKAEKIMKQYYIDNYPNN